MSRRRKSPLLMVSRALVWIPKVSVGLEPRDSADTRPCGTEGACGNQPVGPRRCACVGDSFPTETRVSRVARQLSRRSSTRADSDFGARLLKPLEGPRFARPEHVDRPASDRVSCDDARVRRLRPSFRCRSSTFSTRSARQRLGGRALCESALLSLSLSLSLSLLSLFFSSLSLFLSLEARANASAKVTVIITVMMIGAPSARWVCSPFVPPLSRADLSRVTHTSPTQLPRCARLWRSRTIARLPRRTSRDLGSHRFYPRRSAARHPPPLLRRPLLIDTSQLSRDLKRPMRNRTTIR